MNFSPTVNDFISSLDTLYFFLTPMLDEVSYDNRRDFTKLWKLCSQDAHRFFNSMYYHADNLSQDGQDWLEAIEHNINVWLDETRNEFCNGDYRDLACGQSDAIMEWLSLREDDLTELIDECKTGLSDDAETAHA